MGKIKTVPWNIYEFLTTEEDIQMFVEASVDEAKNDTDPSCLADALTTAAEARRRLRGREENTADPLSETAFNENPGIREFDETARLFGYHLTLTPVA